MEEKEGQACSELKGQENLGEDEAGSKDEESETDYSSEDEEILTKAGRPMHLGWHSAVLAPAGPHGAGMSDVRVSCYWPPRQGLLCGGAASLLILSSIECWLLYSSPTWNDLVALGLPM